MPARQMPVVWLFYEEVGTAARLAKQQL